MKVPLQARLKKESHRRIAYAQDIIVKKVYETFEKPVLHGGTGIWRCYSGKRFSEDLDFYLPKDKDKIKSLFENFERQGFKILKKKISDNGIYSELEFENIKVRFEAIFKKINGSLCDYESSDANIISVYSLTKEEFIIEKANTYLKRRKIRDLWDVFFLLKEMDSPQKIKELANLIKNYKEPIDEDNLKVIILEGLIPSSKEMIAYIKRKWENKYI